jgi:hypothetical protein
MTRDEFELLILDYGNAMSGLGQSINADMFDKFGSKAQSSHLALLAEYDRLTAENAQLLAVCNAVEWEDYDGDYYCPWCKNNKKYGHDKECMRQAAIRATEEAHNDKD